MSEDNFNEPLIIEDYPLLVLPKLAQAIGLNEAIVVQQLQFLLKNKNNGKEVDGHRWIYNTLEQWERDHFPFWAEATIKRIFWNLEEMQIVISCQPEGVVSRRKYYRLNAGMMVRLKRGAVLKPARNAHSLRRDQVDPIGSEEIKLIPSVLDQVDPFHARARLEIAETTTETTGAPKRASSSPGRKRPVTQAVTQRDLAGMVFPAPFNAPSFAAAIERWRAHKARRGEQMTRYALELNIKACLRWGLEASLRYIDFSIEGNFQGIKQPFNEQKGGQKNFRPTAAERVEEDRKKTYALDRDKAVELLAMRSARIDAEMEAEEAAEKAKKNP